jgi:hypothetical protein
MTRRSMLVVLPLLAAALLVPLPRAAAQVQQLPDSTFLPTVAQPAFTKRHPRVALDEAHHNFHTLDGRYRAFGALLRADGCEVAPTREPFTAKSLAGFDVLVIANAGARAPASATDSTAMLPAFAPEEIEAVHRWVGDGGALLLIADHAPFGTAAAALSHRFGVDMSQGYTGDSLQAVDAGSVTNLAFTRERGTLGDHPIMNGLAGGSGSGAVGGGSDEGRDRINRVVAFTGQSLLGPAGSTPLMLLSEGSFDLPPAALKMAGNPAAMMAKSVPAKGRSMAVALTAGRGRVVVQGEAAMLSAQIVVRPGQEPYKFGMNQPGLGNQQYALNVVRWLARAGEP